MSVIQISENECATKIKEYKVLVDCYADWCGPCRMLSPIIDELADSVKECTFLKLNIDEAQNVAKEYGIMSIPTLLFFKDGKLEKTVIGLKSKEELESVVRS